MQSGSDKYNRAQAFKDLRELHKLYNKCQPVKLVKRLGRLTIGVCSCGRFMKHNGGFKVGGEIGSVTWVPSGMPRSERS